MDAASTRSFGTPPTDRGASSPNHAAWARLPHPTTVGHLAVPGRDRRGDASSATWTSSSGDWADVSEADDVEDRREFVDEYNRVARKHGIRPLEPDDYIPSLPGQTPLQQRRSWFSRTFLRQVSTSSDASSTKSDKRIKNRRSVSDLALQLMNGTKRDSLKDENLQSLVRICGKSKLYLPSEYAPGSLVLPTCFRATAQYLVQHAAETRGVFRIPGSVRIVNALYAYYCADGEVDEISSATCCPNLPSHIKAGTHDVASTFKRLLSGLPGGILGSLTLFDALVAIQSQLNGEAEILKTKQTNLRARLMALAIGTVKSQLRRNLICAVFGLLCLIGRAAEVAPREDEHGRPLPTSDLMGYNALGIVFGPLLVGDLLSSYEMKVPRPASGPALFPVTPPNVKKQRRKSKLLEGAQQPALSIDKIHVANSVTEMLITHWREVVRHMRSLRALKSDRDEFQREVMLRPSTESFTMRMPYPPSDTFDSGESPFPPSPTPGSVRGMAENSRPSVVLPRRRPRVMRPLSSSATGVQVSVLSPPVEEPSPAEFERARDVYDPERRQSYATATDDSLSAPPKASSPSTVNRGPRRSKDHVAYPGEATTPQSRRKRLVQPGTEDSTVLSSKGATTENPLVVSASTKPESAGQQFGAAFRGANPFKRRPYKSSTASNSTERISQDTPRSMFRGSFEGKPLREDKPKKDVFGRGRLRLTGWKSRRRSLVSTDTASSASNADRGDDTWRPRTLESPSGLVCSNTKAENKPPPRSGGEFFGQGSSGDAFTAKTTQQSSSVGQSRPLQVLSGNTAPRERYPETAGAGDNPDAQDRKSLGGTGAGRRYSGNSRALPLGPRPNPAQSASGIVPRSRPENSAGSGVKAMAAMFESASRTPTPLPSPREKPAVRADSKPNGMLSPYTVNPSPAKSPRNSPKPPEPATSVQHPWMSTIPGWRLREPRLSARGQAARESSSSSADRRSVSGASRGKTVSMTGSTVVSPGSKVMAEGRSPREGTTPKQPGRPATESSGPNTGGSPSIREIVARDAPGDSEQNTAERTDTFSSTPIDARPSGPSTPHPSQSSRLSTPSHTPSKGTEEASPASTTRRFPLALTPDHHQRRTPRTLTPTHTPAQSISHSKPCTPSSSSSNNGSNSTPVNGASALSSLTPTTRARTPATNKTELERLRAQLRLTREECAMWRARAERAERRAFILERGVGGVSVLGLVGGGGGGGVKRMVGEREEGDGKRGEKEKGKSDQLLAGSGNGGEKLGFRPEGKEMGSGEREVMGGGGCQERVSGQVELGVCEEGEIMAEGLREMACVVDGTITGDGGCSGLGQGSLRL